MSLICPWCRGADWPPLKGSHGADGKRLSTRGGGISSIAPIKHFLLVLAFLIGGLFPAGAVDWPLCVEAEDLEFAGDAAFMRDGAGYSGLGFVRIRAAPDSSVIWRVTVAEAGIYRLQAMVAAPYGSKGYLLEVNGQAQGGFFRGSDELLARSLGLVELRAGENVISLGRGWGHYDIDYLQLAPAEPYAPPLPVPAALSDPQATPEAKALCVRLCVAYGQGTISGQYRTFGQASFLEAEGVQATSGKYPVMHGADLMPFSPSFVEHEPPPAKLIDDLVEAGKAGHPILLMWHWTLPTPADLPYYKGFHKMPGAFDLGQALQPGTPGYARLLSDLDAIAIVLHRFQDEKIPVLWRPLHEADGAWFWWGGSGPEAFQQLWRLVHQRLTERNGLHNLIWVYSSSDALDLTWYPGDDVVDIVAPDIYSTNLHDPLTEPWEHLQKRFDGCKLLALGEVGGVPDIGHMHRLGARWSFFLSWTEGLGPASMAPADVREIYNDPKMVTFEKWRN